MQKIMLKRRCGVTQFLELFCSLIHSGIVIPVALKILSENPGTEKYAKTTEKQILMGMSVSSALCIINRRLKKYRTRIISAEETGELETVLIELTEEFKETDEDKRNLVIVLIYPLFICLLAMALSIFLIIYGIPYINLIADVSREAFINTVIKANVWLLASLFIIFFVSDYLLHRNDFAFLLFSNLYSLYKTGIEMEESLLFLLKEGSFSKKDEKSIYFILKGLRDGKRFSSVAEEIGRFDIFCISWLIASGESGELKNALKTISSHYNEIRKKTREKIRRFTEPAFLAVSGIYVLILISGCIIPVFLSLGVKIL